MMIVRAAGGLLKRNKCSAAAQRRTPTRPDAQGRLDHEKRVSLPLACKSR